MHLFSAIPDITYDKKANITTTTVWMEQNNSLSLCTILWSISALGLYGIHQVFLPMFIYPIISLYLLFEENQNISKIYWAFPYINSILGCAYFWIILFHN